MILIAAGSLVAISFLIKKVIGVVSELATGSAAEPYCSSAFATVGCTFAVAMPALAVLLMTLGATVPTLGPRLEQLARGLQHRRSLRRLRPLWETLHAALPDIALIEPGCPPGSTPPGEISERLYRRVVAIRDGLLALQPYRDPADTCEEADAATLTDWRHAAAIEAANIRTALHRRRHDMPPRGYSPGVNPTVLQSDLDSEVRWLTEVSDALAREELRSSATSSSSSG